MAIGRCEIQVETQNEKWADKNSLKQLNIMDRIGVNLPIFV